MRQSVKPLKTFEKVNKTERPLAGPIKEREREKPRFYRYYEQFYANR